MVVMKFGGTSVGSPERIKEVVSIITKSGEPTFVVLSAMSGTTNTLLEIADYLYKKNPESANEVINNLEQKYFVHIENLFTQETYRKKMHDFVAERFNYIRTFTKDLFTSFEENTIVAQGEILSTTMVTNYLQQQGIKATLLSAIDFMRTDKNAEPDATYIKTHLQQQLEQNPGNQIYITQGFICKNAFGEIDNLQRGGSDYTASLIGAAIQSEEIQIWTDIDGLHNNDPRIVAHTEPVRQLYFEEASELAYFGAKILHPTCVQPAKYAGIPVRLKYTMQPEAEGTLINAHLNKGTIKAIAVKDNIVAIKIKSSKMLGASGFLRKVFEVFESYQVTTEMLSTSEVGISITIENNAHLPEIIDELKQYGTVTADNNMCIVCVVGDLDWKNVGFETRILKAFEHIPMRMMSYGGSNFSISFLIDGSDKQLTLQTLQNTLFAPQSCS